MPDIQADICAGQIEHPAVLRSEKTPPETAFRNAQRMVNAGFPFLVVMQEQHGERRQAPVPEKDKVIDNIGVP